MQLSTITNTFIILFGSIVILILGKSILFPFLFALLIYFLIRAIRRVMDRYHLIHKNIPSWVKNTLAGSLIFVIIFLLGDLLVYNGRSLAYSFTTYQSNFDALLQQLNANSGMDLSGKLAEKIGEFEFSKIINPLLNSISDFMGKVLMAFFYILFLFFEQSSFINKLKLIFHKQEEYAKVITILHNIENAITHYIGLKTLISLISATLCFVTLLFFGIKSPLLWAFLVFVFNFIPIIGPIVAVFLPSFFAVIQLGEFTIPLILFFILGFIQTMIGYLLEPKLMGDSLNISPLVALISLAFWGAIWGVTGMIVSVPITVILIIVLSQIKKTRPLAILLSQNGKV